MHSLFTQVEESISMVSIVCFSDRMVRVEVQNVVTSDSVVYAWLSTATALHYCYCSLRL